MSEYDDAMRLRDDGSPLAPEATGQGGAGADAARRMIGQRDRLLGEPREPGDDDDAETPGDASAAVQD